MYPACVCCSPAWVEAFKVKRMYSGELGELFFWGEVFSYWIIQLYTLPMKYKDNRNWRARQIKQFCFTRNTRISHFP